MNGPDKKEKRLALPFFLALAILTLLAFAIPLRPTESHTEKRLLTPFPAFSAQALLDGSYFDDINAWFSDTFPGREGWLAVSSRLESLHGLTDNTVDLDSIKNPQPTEDLDALLNLPAPTPAPTPDEAPAEATAAPVPTATPEPTPLPTIDPEFSVEDWEGFDANDELTMFGGSFMINGVVFAQMGFGRNASDQYNLILNYAASYLEAAGLRLINVPAPTSVGVLISPSLLPELNCADQGKILSYLFQNEADSIVKVNAFNDLVEHNDEYIYYYGDHHWTALGAYYGYVAFCRSVGFVPVPLSEYEEVNMGRYRGTYYYSIQQNDKVKTDEVIAYVPPGNVTMDILGSSSEQNGIWGPVVDKRDAEDNLKYICFINGDNPVTVLTNHDLPEDAPSCVVVKDSFGNPFVVYLTQHYRQVVVLDYRKVTQPASYFAELYGATDVILCQSLGVSQTFGPQTLLPHLLK